MSEAGGPYNPLDRRNLGRSVEAALLTRPPVALATVARFRGAGVYALYYVGPFPLYSPIASTACRTPIYVGKADLPGARKGLLTGRAMGTPLWARLNQHARSLGYASNLELADFRCRYLVVDDIWIPLGESLIIGNYRPVWNVVVDGFGNHDPGGGRRAGRSSEWDALHPGRPWNLKMQPGNDASAIAARVASHFREHPEPPTAQVPDDL